MGIDSRNSGSLGDLTPYLGLRWRMLIEHLPEPHALNKPKGERKFVHRCLGIDHIKTWFPTQEDPSWATTMCHSVLECSLPSCHGFISHSFV